MKIILSLLLFLAASGPALAAEPAAADGKIRDALKTSLPGLVPDSVQPTPIDGLYEVVFGSRIFYVTADGRYLMQGNIVDLQTRTGITEERLAALKLDALEGVGEDRMVIFGPQDAEHTVTVFTDIDCGYCRKLHSEMDRYNDAGIRIRYLFYPRAGIGSDAYRKAVSVWCADDRNEAMNTAKAGGKVEDRSCDNPVDSHYSLGQSFGIQGTPALVLESGEVIPGYIPPRKLRQVLDQDNLAGK
jgi:thiol:disulfide interchange protein DsbC